MNKKRNWAIAVVISAAAGLFALQTVSAPTPQDLPGPPPTVLPTVTHTSTPTYEGCGYMWAYHNDVELSAKINASIQAIEESASARAQLFGEDCVYADGHSTFSAMETDFYIQLPVEDLAAEEEFGNWIAQGMDIVLALPDAEIAGRKGFVEFSFIRNETEQITVRVTIDDYLNSTDGSSGAVLFRKFYTPIPTSAPPVPITPTSTP
jgi:hypothetical protein